VDTQIDIQLTREQLQAATEMLKLVSDPTRFKILRALLHGEHSVNELAEHVGAQSAAVSQHLARLRTAQLVKARRDGNKMFYATDNNHIHTVIEQALSHAAHIAGEKRYGK